FCEAMAGGLLLRRETDALYGLLRSPKKPFVAILGGAKVSDKLGVVSKLMGKVDRIAVGGAMAYTFLKAQGVPTGKSRVEEDRLEIARSIMENAKKANVELILPRNH